MNKFDETLINIIFEGSPFLGDTLTARYKINESSLQTSYKTNIRDFEYKMSVETEWIIVEPVDNKIIKIVKGMSIELDYETFEKKIKVHATPKVDGMDYIGMPYQKEYSLIDLNPVRLAEYVKGTQVDDKRKCDADVIKIYSTNASNLHEYNQKIYSQYNFSFTIQHIDFWYHSYKDYVSLDTHKKKLKHAIEEKNYLKTNYDVQKTECDKLRAIINELEKENGRLTNQNEYLIEEKNFFMNSKFFKNTQEASFLDERSGEITNNILNFNSKDFLPNIPMVTNQTFELTMMEDDVNHQGGLLNDKSDLEERIAEYEHLIKNYRKEIENYKLIYSQNRIDLINNENRKLKIKVSSLQNSIEDYKSKLLKFDFAYKYISNELEAMRKISLFTGVKGPDENFLVANNIVNRLTHELADKTHMIDSLHQKINALKNELTHNQTF